MDRDGELVGELNDRLRVNGTSWAPTAWNERPGFFERMEAAGQDPEVIRRMIHRAGAVV